MSALPSSKKTHSEKHKQIFRQLLKELPNKTCVDCKTAVHPRWASWNLGCFICIRCSGIHRSMGTHISRVKSVDLDVWTDEQVESMVKWGNAKCNIYWEAKLPQNYVPDASKIENFIRTKYDMKKWAALPKIPDPMSIAKGAVDQEVAPVSRAPASSKPPVAAQPSQKQSVKQHLSLLDDDFGSFASSTLTISSPSPVQTVQSRAPPARIVSPEQIPKQKEQRADLKKSILSLYSSPSSSSSSFQNQSQSVPLQSPLIQPSHNTRQLQPPAHSDSVSSVSNSLLGLNFGNEHLSSAPNIALSTPKPKPTLPEATPQFRNEWNESSLLVNQWASPLATPTYNGAGSFALGANFSSGTFGTTNPPQKATLDDDLFKNVWS